MWWLTCFIKNNTYNMRNFLRIIKYFWRVVYIYINIYILCFLVWVNLHNLFYNISIIIFIILLVSVSWNLVFRPRPLCLKTGNYEADCQKKHRKNDLNDIVNTHTHTHTHTHIYIYIYIVCVCVCKYTFDIIVEYTNWISAEG